jgi:hypothetical protein
MYEDLRVHEFKQHSLRTHNLRRVFEQRESADSGEGPAPRWFLLHSWRRRNNSFGEGTPIKFSKVFEHSNALQFSFGAEKLL